MHRARKPRIEEKIAGAHSEFNKILGFVTAEALTLELHVVESEIFRMLLRLGRMLLELFFLSVGTGRLERTVTLEDGSVLCFRRESPGKCPSIFGEVTILRAYSLGDGGKGVFPLDARLNMPGRIYSHLLQKWMTLWGVRATSATGTRKMTDIRLFEAARTGLDTVMVEF